jgi:hypothetical protein
MFEIENNRFSFWQWDLNQRIVVEGDGFNEVHFCHETDDVALASRVYEDGGRKVANVPNILLQSAETIRAYAYVKTDNEKYTKLEAWFTVTARPKPADYIYTETEVYTVEEMLDEALQAAKDSGDFKGDKGDKGDPGTTDHALLTNRDQADQHPISAITGLEEALANAGGGEGGSYELPIATPETLGGVQPTAKTEEMTQSVGVDETGGLWTKPSGGGSGGDSKLRLIREITLTEDTYTIDVNTDSDGNPFELTEVVIYGMTQGTASLGQLIISSCESTESKYCLLKVSSFRGLDTTKRFWFANFSYLGTFGRWVRGYNDPDTSAEKAVLYYQYNCDGWTPVNPLFKNPKELLDKLNFIRITSNTSGNNFATGSTLRIYGR